MFLNGVEQLLLMKVRTCHLVQHLYVAYIIVLTNVLLYLIPSTKVAFLMTYSILMLYNV